MGLVNVLRRGAGRETKLGKQLDLLGGATAGG
jgi:hypothetical protein